jgi:branched-chain amino acid aminotransferase
VTHGSEHFPRDDRNAGLLIHLDGRLVQRSQAVVSVFDSGFLLGDGVWEGIRIYNRRPAFLGQHLDRLWEGLRALDMDPGVDQAEMSRRITECTDGNHLDTGAHLRVMVTRGERSAPFQDPSLCIGAATIAIVPQFMQPAGAVQAEGLRVGTVAQRRGRPDVQDPKLNSHSKLNCITACIAARKGGHDEALMLDPQGFVATCNSTHFFVVRRGEVWTSTGDYCLGGITRQNVLHLCRENGIMAREKNFSLTEVYGAQEAFCTGTLIGLMPVHSVDGRSFERPLPGPVTRRLQEFYKAMIVAECGAF